MDNLALIIMLMVGSIIGGMYLGIFIFKNQTQSTIQNLSDVIVGDTYCLERAFLINVHVPNANVEKVLKSVTIAAPLDYGNYDQVAFLDAPGLEQFRPKTESKAGDYESAGRELTTNISFSIPQNTMMLKKILDAIRQVHSYEEPVIYVRDVWRSRATGGDDENPNRWWNSQPNDA
jgi:hypothetical protein